ncbi:MAG: hypothetical protein JWQ99_2152 [Blastococcus sp.]|jgi:NADPH:quinone reductase-like Zn-dependent oxidoreductase|nr:hypothetical protein [Blastococcus sp.]
MKAIIQGSPGPPGVLRLLDTDLPEIGPHDVGRRAQAEG